MKAYSDDLRQRVLQARAKGAQRPAVIAAQYGISKSTLDKWWAVYQRDGRTRPLPHGGGRQRTLVPYEPYLRQRIAAHPDLTLSDLQHQLYQTHQVQVSSSMMSRTVQRLRLPRKKKRSTRANG